MEDCQYTIIKKKYCLFMNFSLVLGDHFFLDVAKTVAVFCLYMIPAYYLVCTIFMDNAARIANILHMGSVNAS